MKLKVSTPTPIRLTSTGRKSKEDGVPCRQSSGGIQEAGGDSHNRIAKTSSSSKLKAMVKNGKNKALVLIKVLPNKSAVQSNESEKRDYDTDSSSSQDQVTLLPPGYEGSTDEESRISGEGVCNEAQFSPFADHELPIATPLDEPPRITPTRQVRQATIDKRDTLCVVTQEKPLNDKTVPYISQPPVSVKGANLETRTTPGTSTCSMSPEQQEQQHQADYPHDEAPQQQKEQQADYPQDEVPQKQQEHQADYPQDEAPQPQKQQEQQQADHPHDEAPERIEKPHPKHKVSETKKSHRHHRRKKDKTRRNEEVVAPDDEVNEETKQEFNNKVDKSNDFFLMTVEDMQEISKMARKYYANEKTTTDVVDNGSEESTTRGPLFTCNQVKDVIEWLLCTSIQGGGRHTMTRKQARTFFADVDMQQDYRSEALIDESYYANAGAFGEQDYNSLIVQENDDDDSDDGGDFYFEEQTNNTTARKIVRQFRPTGLIHTEDLAVAYRGNLKKLEDTIETVLVLDDKKHGSDSIERQMERYDCEYGDELSCPADEMEDVVHDSEDSIFNFDETKINYDYKNYQVKTGPNDNKLVEGLMMELDAIVYETDKGDGCWDSLSMITTHSMHTTTSQHTAMHRRLQQLETALARLRKEYLEIASSNEEAPVEQIIHLDDLAGPNELSGAFEESSIDGTMNPLNETNDGPQSSGDSKSVRSAELQSKRAVIKVLQEEKNVLEKRVQELVSMMEASAQCHSKEISETKKASQAMLEELRFQQKGSLEEATKKIQELESRLTNSQTKMTDIREKYSRDLEAAKLLQSNRLLEIQNEQKTAVDAATSKIEELELNMENAKKRLEELKEKYSRDLEAAERAELYKTRESDLRERDLRSRLEEVKKKAEKDRKESDRKVREISDAHTRQIEEMIRQLDVVVAEHEKQHAKEYEKLTSQLDLVVTEHEEKCDEMDKLAKEKDALIANLESQLAAAERRLDKSPSKRLLEGLVRNRLK